MSIGDINSSARGTGARFNTGKPAMELLPISELARFYHFRESGDLVGIPPSPAVQCLYFLGEFQEGGDATPLLNIINILSRLGGIRESAHVFDYGRGKYAAWNWAKGMPWSVPIACASRHLQEVIEHGVGSADGESNRTHVGHVLCNVWMLLLYIRTYRQGDDRPPRELFAGSVPGAPPLPAIETITPLPMIERRASPRPQDADLMRSAAALLTELAHDEVVAGASVNNMAAMLSEAAGPA